MKKLLTVTLTILLIFSLMSVFVFANDGQETAAESNLFSEIYSMLLQHSDKILSALAFCASLFLAFAYRSGIIPLIKGGLNTLGTAVNKFKEEAKDKLCDAEKSITALTEKLGTLEERLAEVVEDKKRAENMQIIMESQIDMLYDIFMSSSLPLFQKEAVGEKISAMKKKLVTSEGESDE